MRGNPSPVVLSSRGPHHGPRRSSFLRIALRYQPCNEVRVRGTYYVYIVTNRRNGTLYTGVTNDLKRRIWQHKNKTLPGFTAQYGLGQLVYFETFYKIGDAIDREKQIKAGSRVKKLALIEQENAAWTDLSADWF